MDSACTGVEVVQSEMRRGAAKLKSWFQQPWSGSHWTRVGITAAAFIGLFMAVRYAHVWIPKVQREARVFGIDFGRDRVRWRAGRMVVKFRARGSRLEKSIWAFEERGGEAFAEDWDRVYRDLLALRFGAVESRSGSKPVFRSARHLLRRFRRMERGRARGDPMKKSE